MEKTTKSFFILGASVAFLLIVGIPAILYFSQFSNSLSHDQTIWGTFGDYLNPFIALLNVAAFVYLTYVIQQQQSAQEKRKMRMPFLVDATHEMVQIAQQARTLVSDTTHPRGTVQELKDKILEFELMYTGYLNKAGLPIEEMQSTFRLVLKVETKPVSAPFSGEWEEVIISSEHFESVRSLALLMRKQIKLLENSIMD